VTWPTVALILVLVLQVEIFVLLWAILVRRPERKLTVAAELAEQASEKLDAVIADLPTERDRGDTMVHPADAPTEVRPPKEGGSW
jgi:hypothetical protein